MRQKLRTRITISLVVVASALLASCAKRAQAADDTAKFYSVWVTNFEVNGQVVIVESIHDGSGYRNYTLLPNGSTPAGSGSFSAANGKWNAAAAAPDNSGTYKFIDDYTAYCTNAAGQAIVWRRDAVSPPPGVAPPNYQQIDAAFLAAANAGATWAMTILGDQYEFGLGVTTDYQQAMNWYQKAAAAGDTGAMNGIGFAWANGWGVTKNPQQALTWFQKAAAGGSYLGMYNTGAAYDLGTGVAVNYQQAMAWYLKAAAGRGAGSAGAMANIGFMYFYGHGVAKNYQQALVWALKGAAAGGAPAMRLVATMDLNGQAVQASRTMAIEWYRAAAAERDSFSLQWLKQNGLL